MRNIVWFLGVFITGCTTALWAPTYTTENVDGFYVNQRDNTLLVSTEANGYIFSIDNESAKALTLSRTLLFRPNFEGFSIDERHNVTGTLDLILLEKNPSAAIEKQLKNLGFTRSTMSSSSSNRFIKQIPLSGSRYILEGELPLTKLEKAYPVSIEQPDSFTSIAGKIVATPVTIAFDAAVVLPAVFVGAFIMAAGSP